VTPDDPQSATPDEHWPLAAPGDASEKPVIAASVRPQLSERIVALVEVILCSDFPTQLVLTQVLIAAGLRPYDESGRLMVPFIVTLSLVDAVALIGLIVVFLRVHGERPRDVFLGTRPVRREIFLGILLAPIILFCAAGVLLAIQNYLPWLHNIDRNPLEDLISTPANAAVFAIVGIVAGGIREEIQRAFVLHRFEQYLGGGTLGLVLFSVIFGAGHLLQGRDAAIVTGLLGLMWGLMYLRRRSVVAPMVSHSIFNVLETVSHIALRGAIRI
jgi:membrane protease YdiL (CAAX protease family)